MIILKCPGCGVKLRLQEVKPGMKIRCKKCGKLSSCGVRPPENDDSLEFSAPLPLPKAPPRDEVFDKPRKVAKKKKSHSRQRNAPRSFDPATLLQILFYGGGLLVMAVILFFAVDFYLAYMDAEQHTYAKNDLKQISVGSYNFHDVYSYFPPRSRKDGATGSHSWMTSLLPFIDRYDLYKKVDYKLDWNDAKNRPPLSTAVEQFTYLPRQQVPAIDSHTGYALAHYAANTHLLNRDLPFEISNITDGTSNTIYAGTVGAEWKPWGDPQNHRDPAAGIGTSATQFQFPSRRNGAIFLFVDGTVRFINAKVDPKILSALATPSGGETVGDYE